MKDKPTISEEQLERVRRLRDMAANPPVDRGHDAPAWELDAEALTALLAAYEQAEARADKYQAAYHQSQGAIILASVEKAEAERDTAQASEARLREALKRADDLILCVDWEDGVVEGTGPEDVQEELDAYEQARASLASTPNPESANDSSSDKSDKSQERN